MHSPLKLRHLGLHRHIVRVKAIDPPATPRPPAPSAASRSFAALSRGPAHLSQPPARIELLPRWSASFSSRFWQALPPAASRPRWPTGCRGASRSSLRARSARPAVRQIAAYDNVPRVLLVAAAGQGALLRGADLARYPLTELAVGLLFAATALVYRHDTAEAVIGLVFVTMLASDHADRPRAADDPQQGPDRRGRSLCLAIAVPTDPAACRSARSPPRRPGDCCSSSSSPTRPGWVSATSSWSRRWASSSVALSPRRSSSRSWPAASSAWR